MSENGVNECSGSRNRSADARTIVTWVIAWSLVGLSSFGLCCLLEETGVIVWYVDGSSHFWFESELKRWIHGR